MLAGNEKISPAILEKELGLTRQTLKRWEEDPAFPRPIRIGHRWYYDRRLVDRFFLNEA